VKRREFIQAAAVAISGSALGVQGQGLGLAAAQDLTPFIREITGGRELEKRGIEIEIPQIAENGIAILDEIELEKPLVEGADDPFHI
jgi:hypothetical protein